MNQSIDTTEDKKEFSKEDKKRFSKSSIIIVLLVAVVIGYFVFVPKTTDQEEPLLVGDNAIYVSDTKPAATITVGFAIFAEGGYVVIHEDNEGNSRSHHLLGDVFAALGQKPESRAEFERALEFLRRP